MTRRTVGDEAEHCLGEVEDWIRTNLPHEYAWPGNYRELEQCVRNIIIRRSYRPIKQLAAEENTLAARFRNGDLTAEQLLSAYASHVYQLTGSYEEAARKMGLDRRTVKAKVESYLGSQDQL